MLLNNLFFREFGDKTFGKNLIFGKPRILEALLEASMEMEILVMAMEMEIWEVVMGMEI